MVGGWGMEERGGDDGGEMERGNRRVVGRWGGVMVRG